MKATDEITVQIADMQAGTSETVASINEISATSQVLTAARSLSSESVRLKTQVDAFLDAVRAA